MTATAIHRELDKEFSAEEVPGLRTVQDIVSRRRQPDPSGMWHVAGAEVEDLARVLPVIAEVIDQTGGPTSFTEAEVRWIARLDRALNGEWEAPGLDFAATAYARLEQAGGDMTHLDHLIAFASRDGGKLEGYMDALEWGKVAPWRPADEWLLKMLWVYGSEGQPCEFDERMERVRSTEAEGAGEES